MINSDEIKELLNRVLAQQDQLLKKQQELEVSIAKLQSSIVTREEIQEMIERRVSTDVYQVESDQIKKRVDALEKRLDEQPATLWSRTNMVVIAIIMAATLVVSLIALLKH
jgi:Pyruvate/2-oxoacid:ferredoxin oxidoreductase gamma subunit